jgi:hypothetical protein
MKIKHQHLFGSFIANDLKGRTSIDIKYLLEYK